MKELTTKQQYQLERLLKGNHRANKANFMLKKKPYITQEGKALNKQAFELQQKEIEFNKARALSKNKIVK